MDFPWRAQSLPTVGQWGEVGHPQLGDDIGLESGEGARFPVPINFIWFAAGIGCGRHVAHPAPNKSAQHCRRIAVSL